MVQSLRSRRADKARSAVPTSALALVDRYVVCVAGACVDLARGGDLGFGVVYCLHPLGHPARGAGYGEHYGEGVGGDPERFVDEARVEVDVGIELAAPRGERGAGA